MIVVLMPVLILSIHAAVTIFYTSINVYDRVVGYSNTPSSLQSIFSNAMLFIQVYKLPPQGDVVHSLQTSRKEGNVSR